MLGLSLIRVELSGMTLASGSSSSFIGSLNCNAALLLVKGGFLMTYSWIWDVLRYLA